MTAADALQRGRAAFARHDWASVYELLSAATLNEPDDLERLATAAHLLGRQPESEDLRARWQALRDGEVDAAKVADSKAKIVQFAERIESQLADGRVWLMGAFSIADLETYAWLRPMRELEADAFAGRDRCRAWMDRAEARPSVQAALARARTDKPEHAFAPGPEINRWG